MQNDAHFARFLVSLICDLYTLQQLQFQTPSAMGNPMQSSPKVLPKQQMAKFGFSGWTLWALCITGLVMVPILTVATLALFPTENIWPHMLNTTLPRYFRTTVSLMVSVGLGAAVVGTVTAWLIARYRFVGGRVVGMGAFDAIGDPCLCGGICIGGFIGICRPRPNRTARCVWLAKCTRLLVP